MTVKNGSFFFSRSFHSVSFQAMLIFGQIASQLDERNEILTQVIQIQRKSLNFTYSVNTARHTVQFCQSLFGQRTEHEKACVTSLRSLFGPWGKIVLAPGGPDHLEHGSIYHVVAWTIKLFHVLSFDRIDIAKIGL